MNRFLTGFAAASLVFAAAAVPVPSDEELERVRPDVELLTKDDYEALRLGSKTHVDLARDLSAYALQPDVDPAARYLMLRASFRQHLHGGDIEEAEAAYGAFKQKLGPEYALSIARFSAPLLGKLVSARKDGAKEFQERLAADDRLARHVESLRTQVAGSGYDSVLRGRLAAACVAMGDWPQALSEYVKCGGDAAEAVRFERRYPKAGLMRTTTADVAEFWWREHESMTNAPAASLAFRARAVKWYRLAITNGTLRSVRRQIAEKRIAETEAALRPSAPPPVPSVLGGIP